MSRPRVAEADRAHFRAIGEASGPLAEDRPPRSLAEMFERLAAIRRSLGPAAEAGLAGEDDSELEAHLHVFRRGREMERRGAKRT